MYAAFLNTSLRLGVYWLVAVGEALAGAACTIGTAILRAPGISLANSRHFTWLATALGFGVWPLAFQLIGGSQSALRFYVAVLATGIVIALQDRYLPRPN
jgi:predicted small integral membrane protein